MKCFDTYEKHIYCLEGNWDKNPRSNKSIRPILEILHSTLQVKYIYRKCQNKDDFLKYLKNFTRKRYSNYPILYLAFHGRTNRIYFGNEYVTLKEIADVLEGKLNGKIALFGCCLTLGTSEKNINSFINRTECSFISGYKKTVDFIPATAFELIFLETLQTYCSFKRIKSAITKNYPNFLEDLHFNMF